MLASVRNVLLAIVFTLAAVACAAPEGEDEVTATDLGAALSRGEAPLSDASFIPSSSLEVGTWAAYTVDKGDRPPTEVLFVNHSDAATSIVVSVDVVTNVVRVISAPPGGGGAPAASALIDDLSALDAASGGAGSVRPQSFGELTATAAKRLLAAAATKLKSSSEELLHAVQNYTGAGYAELNPFLREGAIPASWTKIRMGSQARTLVHALKTLPPVSAETHRWLSVGVNSASGVDRAKLDGFVASLKPGAAYWDRGFMSSTLNETAPSVAGSSTIRFDIKGATGRDISMLSHFPDEKEVLFIPGTRFRIASVKGEFVTRPSFLSTDQWNDFVTVTSEYFPGVTKDSLEAELRNGKIPNLVVELEEIVAH